MNKKTIKIILIIIMLSSINLFSHEHFVRHEDTVYNFSILIPESWKKSNVDMGYKHILILTKDAYTEIKISASRLDDQEKDKWNNWREWYVDGIGKRISKIIETKDVKIEKNVVGRLLVFEYISRKKKILQRILISKFDDKILIIECRSRLKYFSKYSDLFDKVMGSLLLE